MTYDIPHASEVTNLTDSELADFNALLAVWWRKREKNLVRERYYNAHNRLKDLGIAIPPPLKCIKTVVSWPEKAVDYIADRCILEGFVMEGRDRCPELDAAIEENDFLSVYAQAVKDCMVSSVAFLSVTAGGAGEPRAMMTVHSARDGAAIWNDRLNRIRCALLVAEFEYDRDGRIKGPLVMNLHEPGVVIVLRKARNGRYVVERRMEHSQPWPLVEAIRYKPRIGRPFGRSRVSPAVIATTDEAVRERLRCAVSAEFFTAPQKWILGAEDSIFDDQGKWEQYIGQWLAITRDEEGEVPQVGQFPQGSMQPHTEYMRQLAAEFAGETGVPISSLGVIHDNPASAEAIFAAKEDAIIDASNFNRDNASALARIGKLALAVTRGVSAADLDASEKTIKPRFRSPDRPSVASQTSAMIQQASVLPWLAESRVMLEELGYDDAQIVRLLSDKAKAEAKSLIAMQIEANAAERAAGRETAHGGDTEVADRPVHGPSERAVRGDQGAGGEGA